MTTRSILDRLKQTRPRTGRTICEDGVFINDSNHYVFAEITTEELERLKGIYVIQS